MLPMEQRYALSVPQIICFGNQRQVLSILRSILLAGLGYLHSAVRITALSCMNVRSGSEHNRIGDSAMAPFVDSRVSLHEDLISKILDPDADVLVLVLHHIRPNHSLFSSLNITFGRPVTGLDARRL